jgi:hypothetical protein
MYSAEILADSVVGDSRLTTIAVTMPRIVLAEQNTHRVFSRNTASSRAIPVKTRCDYVEQHPFIPSAFGKNKRGMQSDELLNTEDNALAEQIWREALADALRHARRLADIGVHKQYANRLTEPFAWVTQIVSATDWDNYFALRCHKDAQPEIRLAAEITKEVLDNNSPVELKEGQWHLPLVTEADVVAANSLNPDSCGALLAISVARCAAVSYEKHATQKTVLEEIARHDALLSSGHMSPFEHQAKVGNHSDLEKAEGYIGNFRKPWIQYRKQLPNEAVFVSPV